MKIAIVSDIHANPLALDGVLRDIKEKNCDMLICLGDIAMAGYDPNRVIEKFKILTSKNSPIETKMILGNTDLMITHFIPEGLEKIKKVAPVMAYALEDDLKIIEKENIEFMKKFQTRLELEIDGIKIYCCHGSPRRIDENIRPQTPVQELEEMIKGVNADVIVCGHTHVPCGFQLESGVTVMNVGSVGRPMTVDKASVYAILETKPNGEYIIEHQSVPYDNNLVAEKIRERGFEECDVLARMFEG